MPELMARLLQKKSVERDQYFIDLYNTAYKIVESRQKGFISTDLVGEELKILLTNELSHSDFKADNIDQMYKASNEIDLTLVDPPLSPDAGEEERLLQGEKGQKFSAIQNVLVNYLLGEDYKPNPEMALNHWKVAKLASICKEFKGDLDSVISNPPVVIIKFDDKKNPIPDPTIEKAKEQHRAISAMLDILTEKKLHDDDKIKAFNEVFNKEKPNLKQGNDSRATLFVNAVSTVFTQGFKAAYLMLKQGSKEIKQNNEMNDIVSTNAPSPK